MLGLFCRTPEPPVKKPIKYRIGYHREMESGVVRYRVEATDGYDDTYYIRYHASYKTEKEAEEYIQRCLYQDQWIKDNPPREVPPFKFIKE